MFSFSSDFLKLTSNKFYRPYIGAIDERFMSFYEFQLTHICPNYVLYYTVNLFTQYKVCCCLDERITVLKCRTQPPFFQAVLAS
jgi:hypothetical protein